MTKRAFTLSAIAFAVFSIALFLGPRPIAPFSMSAIEKEILFNVRLPRVLVSALMGAALGASGAVLQGMLRNPLADPYILGLSSGAALTAAAGLVLGLGVFSTPLLAFLGAAGAGTAVGLMGAKRGGFLPERLLLAGIGLGFLFSAVLMLIMSVTTDEGLRRVVLWIFGDLSTAEWSLLPFGALSISVGMGVALLRAKALNALMMGDEIAHSLGFSPDGERLVLFVSVCLMVASSVSMGGMIGFVGLLVPHMARFFVGSDNSALIPASAVSGGALLVLSDFAGRTVMSPAEIPSGIVTAILGAPYFLYLLRRRDVMSGLR